MKPEKNNFVAFISIVFVFYTITSVCCFLYLFVHIRSLENDLKETKNDIVVLKNLEMDSVAKFNSLQPQHLIDTKPAIEDRDFDEIIPNPILNIEKIRQETRKSLTHAPHSSQINPANLHALLRNKRSPLQSQNDDASESVKVEEQSDDPNQRETSRYMRNRSRHHGNSASPYTANGDSESSFSSWYNSPRTGQGRAITFTRGQPIATEVEDVEVWDSPKSTQRVPVPAAHFNGDTSKYVYGQHVRYLGNGHLRHETKTYIDWQPGDWMERLGMDDHFNFNHDGSITVKDGGLYFIYAQIYYLDVHDLNGYRVYLIDPSTGANRTLLQCTTMTHLEEDEEHRGNTCFTGGLAWVEGGQKVVVINLDMDRYSLFEPGKSFVGLFRVVDGLFLFTAAGTLQVIMAVETILLDFTVDPSQVKSDAQTGLICSHVEDVLRDYLRGFKALGSHKLDDGGLLRLYMCAGCGTVTLKIYAQGLITLNVDFYKTEKQEPLLNYESSKILEHNIGITIDCFRSKLIPAIKRGSLLDIYLTSSDDRLLEYDIDELVFEERTIYQKVQIVHSKSLGNMLVLDDVQNIAESDLIYTETLMSRGFEDYNDKEILILGGGDGALLFELLKENPKEVVMLEIDEVVMKACSKYMRSICGEVLDTRSGPNYEIILGDCVKSLERFVKEGRKFDYVFGDLTDIPISDKPCGEMWDFILSVLSVSRKIMRPDGKFMTHLIGSSSQEALRMYESQLLDNHPGVIFTTSHAFIPSFLEDWVFGQVSFGGPVDNGNADQA